MFAAPLNNSFPGVAVSTRISSSFGDGVLDFLNGLRRLDLRVAYVLAFLLFVSLGFLTWLRTILLTPPAQIPLPPFPISVATVVKSGIYPDRLIVPKLDVDAHVQPVGVTVAGAMGTPKGVHRYADVAWYKYGPLPGAQGHAVLAGHLDNGYGLAAVFRNLNALRSGDLIIVRDSGDREVHFVVATTTDTSANQTRSGRQIFTTVGKPTLVLITCEGIWLPSKKMYTGRFIVFATLAS